MLRFREKAIRGSRAAACMPRSVTVCMITKKNGRCKKAGKNGQARPLLNVHQLAGVHRSPRGPLSPAFAYTHAYRLEHTT
jgi:hypothetical protein